MKNLIVYYSFTNNNEKLAYYLRERLNSDIAKIETIKKRTGFSIFMDLVFNRKPKIKEISYPIDYYDHVIFIAPIWGGKIAMPMKTLLTNEKDRILQYSFITLCGGYPGQKDKILNELVSTLQKQPVKLAELWVNDLLPEEKKNTIKFTTGFRIAENQFFRFDKELRDFIKEENLVKAI